MGASCPKRFLIYEIYKLVISDNSEQILQVNNQIYKYFDLKIVAKKLNIDLSRVPISIKIILENLIRNEDGENVTKDMIAKSKNIDVEPRANAGGDVFINGMRVKAISGADSSRLKIKKINKTT